MAEDKIASLTEELARMRARAEEAERRAMKRDEADADEEEANEEGEVLLSGYHKTLLGPDTYDEVGYAQRSNASPVNAVCAQLHDGDVYVFCTFEGIMPIDGIKPFEGIKPIEGIKPTEGIKPFEGVRFGNLRPCGAAMTQFAAASWTDTFARLCVLDEQHRLKGKVFALAARDAISQLEREIEVKFGPDARQCGVCFTSIAWRENSDVARIVSVGGTSTMLLATESGILCDSFDAYDKMRDRPRAMALYDACVGAPSSGPQLGRGEGVVRSECTENPALSMFAGGMLGGTAAKKMLGIEEFSVMMRATTVVVSGSFAILQMTENLRQVWKGAYDAYRFIVADCRATTLGGTARCMLASAGIDDSALLVARFGRDEEAGRGEGEGKGGEQHTS